MTGLARRPGAGWDVTTEADGVSTTTSYDFVVVCTGQFSSRNKPIHPGAEDFAARGGRILHSSEYNDARAMADKRVVVLGFSKSATDVAVSAVKNGAAAVTIVFREPTYPHLLRGVTAISRRHGRGRGSRRCGGGSAVTAGANAPSAEDALCKIRLWIVHWERDRQFGLAPTEESIRDSAELIDAVLGNSVLSVPQVAA